MVLLTVIKHVQTFVDCVVTFVNLSLISMIPLMETFMVLFVTYISLLLKFFPAFYYFQLLCLNF